MGDGDSPSGPRVMSSSTAVLCDAQPGKLDCTAEIYRQWNLSLPCQSHLQGSTVGDDVRIVLFVVLREEVTLDDDRERLKTRSAEYDTTPCSEIIAQVPTSSDRKW